MPHPLKRRKLRKLVLPKEEVGAEKVQPTTSLAPILEKEAKDEVPLVCRRIITTLDVLV